MRWLPLLPVFSLCGLALLGPAALETPRAPARQTGLRLAGAPCPRSSPPAPDEPAPPEPRARGIDASAGAEPVPGCTLHVDLRDVIVNRPAWGWIELWRLDCPEGGGWTAGDRLCGEALVEPPGGHDFTGLAAGVYRLVILDQARGMPEPGPLRLGPGRTVAQYPTRKAHLVRVDLRVVDPAGNHFSSAGVELEANETRGCRPDWLRPGRPLADVAGEGAGPARRYPCVQPHRETRRVAARDGVCHVADAWEDSVETERWLDARVEVGEAWTPVRWRISAAAQRGVLEALVLPRRECEAAVRLPDGASAVDAGARVETWVEPAPDRWETMLHVRATLPGYRQLEASQPARDPLPCWYLRAGQD